MNPKETGKLSVQNARGYREWLVLVTQVGFAVLALYQVWASTQKKLTTQRAGRPEISVQVSPITRKNLTYFLFYPSP